MPSLTRQVDAAAAGFLTIAAIGLHYVAAVGGGGLWRDEANTVGLATLPTTMEVWKHLQYDSFPILWIAIVRGFAAIFGPMNDHAFRVLGMLVGVSLVVALWYHARAFGHRFPVFSLAFVALSPTVIRWGDSIRGYGLGMTLIVVTNALVWRFLDKPSLKRLAAATVFSVLSVQTLYYNAVLLLAVCAAAIVVCALRRDLRNAIFIAGMGAIAAFSLIPYLAVIARASTWNELVRIPAYTVGWFWLRLFEAVTPTGSWIFFAWGYGFVLAGLVGVSALVAPRVLAMSKAERETAIYALTLLVVGVLGSFVFLRMLRYFTQPWYYLTLMLVTGVCIDLLLGVFPDGKLRVCLSLAVMAVGACTAWGSPRFLIRRMTNADLASARLEGLAGPRDLIIVNPWYEGVSFDRYYHGHAPWMTAPAVKFHRFHRYDLVMDLNKSNGRADADQTELVAARQALMSGKTVYIVGNYPAPRPEFATDRLIPVRQSIPLPAGAASESTRSLDLGDLLHMHATDVVRVSVPIKRAVNDYEAMTVTAVRGWK